MNFDRSPLTRPRSALTLAFLLLALTLALSGTPARAQSNDAATAAPRPPVDESVALPTDQLIIKFRTTAGPASLSATAEQQLAGRLSAAAGVSLSFVRPMAGDAYVMQLPARLAEAEVARISADLAALPEVEYAEPNSIMQLVGRPTQAAGPQSVAQAPDDSSYADQWHYRYDPGTEEGLNLPAAWDITTGLNTTVVAVLDTGILPHADLSGRALPGYDFISSSTVANDGDGRDANPSDPGDWVVFNQCGAGRPGYPSTWHGTHVAGTIAANSNNGSDVAGVNWKARILPLRVLGSCGGALADIVDAIYWSAGLPVPGVPDNPNPADVINLSLGGTGVCSESYQNAFDAINAAGVVAVVAAGNSNTNVSNARPANCNNVITVAATTRAGDRSYYSNYGSLIEVSAPGGETIFDDAEGILSTLNDGATGPGDDMLAFYQGTSMAAPHVAGLASLIVGQAPGLTPAEVTAIILDTARDFPGGSDCNGSICGAGIADAFGALSALEMSLDAPALVAPADSATVATATPTLEWAAVDGAERYNILVATDNGFANIVAAQAGLSGTSFTPPALAEDTYFWRVRAAAAEEGPWSDVWRFTVALEECQVPATPVQLAPADGSTSGSLMPTFRWETSANATDYEFRLGEEPDVSDSLIVGLPQAAQYRPEDPLVGETTYYWKVRARNLSGECDEVSDWSEVWSVTIDEAAVEEYFIYLPAVFGSDE